MKEYYSKNKKSILWFVIAIVVIFLTSLTQSLIQNSGGSIAVSDLRNAKNTGTIQQRITLPNDDPANPTPIESTREVKLTGEVASGILFKPKSATSENKMPAVVLTHGYLNNRELQLPFAIELARRGFVVLTVDREGHGNYNNVDNASAVMATKGLYESAKYLYNLDYVDQSRIGITGHSMGGYTTAVTLMNDSKQMPTKETVKVDGKTGIAYGYGIVKAGLIQGWSTFITAGKDVSVGLLKASDDEFFFTSTDTEGNKTISRQFLQSTGAAKFVGVTYAKGDKIDIKNGAHYVGGSVVETTLGTALNTPFRAIYEADEIHPLNHWSIPSTKSMIDFFYTAFGTPTGYKVKGVNNQVWPVKELFSFIGMLALLSLIFPIVKLFLTVPLFTSLRKRRTKTVNADGTLSFKEEVVTKEAIESRDKPLKTWVDWVLYFLAAVICTFFSGFSIRSFCNKWGNRWFPHTQLYPQDTTNWVALWSVACGLVAILVILLFFIVRRAIRRAMIMKQKEVEDVVNPFETAKISSFSNAIKTVFLAFLVVFALYLIVFVNWAAFKVDFRLWTLTIKVFNVPEMLPTAIRYGLFFFLFYLCNGIANQTYRTKTLPSWASIAINAFFTVFGISLVMIIQYGTFKSTGVLWQSNMALGYIVLFPIVPILIFATIISRKLYEETGNVYLGSLINAMLFTMITVAGTAASYAYVLG